MRTLKINAPVAAWNERTAIETRLARAAALRHARRNAVAAPVSLWARIVRWLAQDI